MSTRAVISAILALMLVSLSAIIYLVVELAVPLVQAIVNQPGG